MLLFFSFTNLAAAIDLDLNSPAEVELGQTFNSEWKILPTVTTSLPMSLPPKSIVISGHVAWDDSIFDYVGYTNPTFPWDGFHIDEGSDWLWIYLRYFNSRKLPLPNPSVLLSIQFSALELGTSSIQLEDDSSVYYNNDDLTRNITYNSTAVVPEPNMAFLYLPVLLAFFLYRRSFERLIRPS